MPKTAQPNQVAFNRQRSTMRAVDQAMVAARERLAAPVFYVISILLFPISLAGYLIWVGKALLGRNTGVSGTAQGPLFARWFMHQLRTRRDDPANRLMLALPGVPPVGVSLVALPTLLAHHVSGYVPKAFRYPFEGSVPIQYEAVARQTYFDSVVDQHLDSYTQLVILGAGFDTRAYRLPGTARVRCFEIDTPKTQALKCDMLSHAGINAAGVTFVAADFAQEEWLPRLVNAGFDAGKPALLLWEGVMMYLDRAAAEATLRALATLAPGSIVAFDYITTEPLESRRLYSRYARAATRAGGEPLKFGIDGTPPSRARLAAFVESCGLALDEQQTLGQETDGQRAWGGFATAIVP